MNLVYSALAVAGGLALAAGILTLTADDAPAPLAATGTVPASAGAALVQVRLPDALSPGAVLGKTAFDARCAQCHGDNAAGRDGFGPPLIHKIYEPSHHGDMAFLMAVRNGVVAHHWRFGNMPAQPGLTDADVAAIVAYVRELQRANGID